jgi:hypothetical protein
MIVELYYHACDVVWRWVVFPEKKRVQVFLAVQVFLGSM